MKIVAVIVSLRPSLVLSMVLAFITYSFAGPNFPVPKEAKHRFIGICTYMENRKPVMRACIVYILPNEPENEYTAYADDNGNIIEIIKHSNKTGRQQKVWPK